MPLRDSVQYHLPGQPEPHSSPVMFERQTESVPLGEVGWDQIMSNVGYGLAEQQRIRYPVLGTSVGNSILGLYSDAVAGLEVRCYKMEGGKEVMVDNPPWVDNPFPNNPVISWPVFISMVVRSLLLEGNAFIFKHKSKRDGSVAGLFCLEPYWVEILGGLMDPVYFVSESYYGISRQENAVRENYIGRHTRDEVLHVAHHLQPGCMRGVSTFTLAKDTVQLQLAARNHAVTYFLNGAVPEKVFAIAPGQMDPDQFQIAIDSFQQEYSGLDAHSSPAFMFGDWKVLDLQANPQNSQMQETQQAASRDISNMTGVLPAVAGDNQPGAVAYASTKGQQSMWYSGKIQPFLRPLEKAFSSLLPTGQRFSFYLDDIISGDEDAKYQQIEKGIKAMVLTPNEGRKRLGYEPHPDPIADKLLIPTQVMPSDSAYDETEEKDMNNMINMPTSAMNDDTMM